jgi:hypothetical protein
MIIRFSQAQPRAAQSPQHSFARPLAAAILTHPPPRKSAAPSAGPPTPCCGEWLSTVEQSAGPEPAGYLQASLAKLGSARAKARTSTCRYPTGFRHLPFTRCLALGRGRGAPSRGCRSPTHSKPLVNNAGAGKSEANSETLHTHPPCGSTTAGCARHLRAATLPFFTYRHRMEAPSVAGLVSANPIESPLRYTSLRFLCAEAPQTLSPGNADRLTDRGDSQSLYGTHHPFVCAEVRPYQSKMHPRETVSTRECDRVEWASLAGPSLLSGAGIVGPGRWSRRIEQDERCGIEETEQWEHGYSKGRESRCRRRCGAREEG